MSKNGRNLNKNILQLRPCEVQAQLKNKIMVDCYVEFFTRQCSCYTEMECIYAGIGQVF